MQPYTKDKDQIIILRIKNEEKYRIARLAYSKKMNISKLIRQLILEELNRCRDISNQANNF